MTAASMRAGVPSIAIRTAVTDDRLRNTTQQLGVFVAGDDGAASHPKNSYAGGSGGPPRRPS
jgi:hypothetical protein